MIKDNPLVINAQRQMQIAISIKLKHWNIPKESKQRRQGYITI